MAAEIRCELVLQLSSLELQSVNATPLQALLYAGLV